MPAARTRVLLARGHQTSPFGLKPWEALPERFDVRALITGSTRYDLGGSAVAKVPVRALRDVAPRGPIGDMAAIAARDRYLKLDAQLTDVDIVHAEDLSLWPSAQMARKKKRFGYRLVVTAWETIPLLDAFRTPHARRYREQVLGSVDLWLPSTERARAALVLEGVLEERVEVVHPGVDVDRLAGASHAAVSDERVLVSPGRLEWEKGHQDVLRAVAALRRGLVEAPEGTMETFRLVVAGAGDERGRLAQHAEELGVGDLVSFRSLASEQMPALYAQASGMVLASLPRSGCGLYPFDSPRCFWEEQFGLVIPEALAAGLPLMLSDSGAIREVAGDAAAYFAPGDWLGLARLIADEMLSRPPGTRVEHSRELVDHYSVPAAAARLASAFDRVKSLPPVAV